MHPIQWYKARRRRTKAATVLGILALLAFAGIAAAYYLGSGTGQAPFTAGHSPTTLTVSASIDSAALPLYPTDSGVGLAQVTADVTSTHGNVGIDTSTITGSVEANGSGDVAGFPGCKAAWFVYTAPSSGSVFTVHQGGSGLHINDAGKIQFLDNGQDQSACSDATPTLDLTVGS